MLKTFRNHLTKELRNFPEAPGPTFESYAVTTAALARSVVEYLHMDDLTVPAWLDSDAYPLKTVLNWIIHHRVLYPERLPPSGETVSILVYSDRAKLYGDRMNVEWTPYRTMLLRLANDDVFVTPYLLRRAVTVLMQGSRSTDKWSRNLSGHQSGEYRRRMLRLTRDGWDMAAALVDAGKTKLPLVTVDCYQEHFDEREPTKSSLFPTFAELLSGYRTTWNWSFFNTDKLTIGGVEKWCIFVELRERTESGTMRNLAIPLDVFVDIFQDIQAQLS